MFFFADVFHLFCLDREQVETLVGFIPCTQQMFHGIGNAVYSTFKYKYYTWPVIPTFCFHIYCTPLFEAII